MEYRLSKDGSVAVSTSDEWKHLDTAPMGAQCQLLTKHRVHVRGILTAANKKDYIAWFPSPKEPQWLKDLYD